MRVLVAVHGYPPDQSGGAELRAARTASGLLMRDNDVRVLCVESPSASRADPNWENAVVEGVPVRRLRFHLNASSDPFRWSYDNPYAGKVLAEMIHEWRPAILHLFSGYLLSASVVRVAAELGVPVVVSLTDYWWLCHRINLLRADGNRCAGPSLTDCARCYAETFRRYRLPAKVWPWAAAQFWASAKSLPPLGKRLGLPRQVLRREMLTRTLDLATLLIAPSRYLADVYIRYGAAPERVRFVRQGVDFGSCLPRQVSSVLRVGYVGQMKPHKGVHLLLDAWSRLEGPRARRLVLFGASEGEDAYGRRLQHMIHQLEEVRWAGSFRGKEVWDVLGNLDVIVVPSSWVENSPNSILEAQAAGVPVIGSNLGGIAELVEHEHNGLLFAPNDAKDLAQQLQRLLDEPDLLQRLSLAAISVRSINDELDQLSDLYDEVVLRSPA